MRTYIHPYKHTYIHTYMYIHIHTNIQYMYVHVIHGIHIHKDTQRARGDYTFLTRQYLVLITGIQARYPPPQPPYGSQ